jgi:hypothetical protein
VGPEALEPLNLVEEFVFLHHAPSVALSEEWLIASHMLGSAREPSSLRGSGRLSLAGALASAEGREGAKDQVQVSIDREPEARVSP